MPQMKRHFFAFYLFFEFMFDLEHVYSQSCKIVHMIPLKIADKLADPGIPAVSYSYFVGVVGTTRSEH